jgi:pantoate--beta-alanine ligase
MQTVSTIAELRKQLQTARRAGRSIGFVPTMGYFHEGHLALMRRAKAENNLVVVSLFVNPTQFGLNEDLAKYPRDLARDQQMAESAGVDMLFHPEATEIYPSGYQTKVSVAGVSQGLCGAYRPGHFDGVATVVLKLFNIVAPDRAYFGEKDAQQLRVIKRMAIDLDLDIEIIGCPIVREPDGLAMSSRNTYLSPEERRAAPILFRSLQIAKAMIDDGEWDAAKLRNGMLKVLATEPAIVLDYLEIVDGIDLQPLTVLGGEVLIALAVELGRTRLIDNMSVTM